MYPWISIRIIGVHINYVIISCTFYFIFSRFFTTAFIITRMMIINAKLNNDTKIASISFMKLMNSNIGPTYLYKKSLTNQFSRGLKYTIESSIFKKSLQFMGPINWPPIRSEDIKYLMLTMIYSILIKSNTKSKTVPTLRNIFKKIGTNNVISMIV